MSECIASKYLKSEGYQITEKNWRCRQGELDIIAQYRDILVIVEVKARQTSSAFLLKDSVSTAKLRQLYFMARLYIYQRATTCRHRHVRFDVIRIPYTLTSDGVFTCAIDHLKNILPYGLEETPTKKRYIRW